MAKTPKEYRRLPGRGMRVEGNRLIAVSRSFCSLWMGGDHLLLVDQTGYTETYKRFYFRDIQAVLIRKTAKGAVVSSVLGLLALLFVFWALAVVNLPGRVTLWIIGGLFAFFALINLWRGPTCVTQFKTPVQTEEVPSWNHLRAARKGLDRIRPRILEAQGAYVPEELKAELEDRLRRQSQAPPGETTWPP
jgi:hypothetical protein